MGLSVDSLNPVSIAQQRPMAYALDNASEVSSSFADSMKVAQGGITPTPPVVYPTAQIESNRVRQTEASQETNRAFNAIASSFGGANTTYGFQGDKVEASPYAMVGSNFDMTA